jgi:diguanylate cyclase
MNQPHDQPDTDINPYTEDWTQAYEYLRLALAFLGSHKIPASPLHFRLAYDSIAGKDESLKQALDNLIADSNGPLTEQLWDLYKKIFAPDDRALEVIRQQLRRIIVEMQGEFEHSGSQLTVFGKALNRFASVLGSPMSPTQLASEVDQVIADTQIMTQAHFQEQQSLAMVMSDIESLRRELEQVKEESLLDALTHISNRRAFDTALERCIHTAREAKSQFCILLADIDHFKRFNDIHGHLVGDRVLQITAAVIKRCIKGSDMVARFGGEEFVILLPHTALVGAMAVAEQVRKAVSSSHVSEKTSSILPEPVTISIGIGLFHRHDTPSELIQRADEALYHAKKNGRNRIEIGS